MEDEKKEVQLFPWETILLYLAGGVFALAILLRFVWGPGGLMTDDWSYQRVILVLFAILFGLGLGWMLYPRRLPAFWKDPED